MRLKRIDLAFTALLVPIDALALSLAALSAYALRFSDAMRESLPILQDLPFATYVASAELFVGIWMGFFMLAGLYSTMQRRAWNELGRIIVACGSGTMVLIASIFFRREIPVSRFIILAVFAFGVLYTFIGRLILRVIRHELLRSGVGHRRVLVVGTSDAATEVIETYTTNPVIGVTILEHYNNWNETTRRAIKKLKDIEQIDGILLADPDMPKKQCLDLIAFCEEENVSFSYLADLFAASFTNIRVNTEAGVPIIDVKRTPLDGWGRIAKRLFDIIGALLLLIITSPLSLISMAIIAIQDGFPVIFQNERVGEHGQLFQTLKLRTMWKKFSIGAQFTQSKENLALEKKLIKEKSIKAGPLYKIANDPRIMPVGNFLRRWSIDELPQFWNVLRGDMSLVGPRPHQPREVQNYEPSQRRVLAVRPGITGMAQISGRSNLSFEDEIRLDTWYIENWSLALDLYIVLKTPFVVLQRKGAY